MWVLRGNATESGDDGGGPGQSSLFFLTVYHPGNSLSGDRVPRPEEPSTSAGSGALLTSLENPLEGIILAPGRTQTAAGPQGEQPLVDRTM
jgi:hypothetical protein